MLGCSLLGGLGIVLRLGLGSGQPVRTHIPSSRAMPLSLPPPEMSRSLSIVTYPDDGLRTHISYILAECRVHTANSQMGSLARHALYSFSCSH